MKPRLFLLSLIVLSFISCSDDEDATPAQKNQPEEEASETMELTYDGIELTVNEALIEVYDCQVDFCLNAFYLSDGEPVLEDGIITDFKNYTYFIYAELVSPNTSNEWTAGTFPFVLDQNEFPFGEFFSAEIAFIENRGNEAFTIRGFEGEVVVEALQNNNFRITIDAKLDEQGFPQLKGTFVGQFDFYSAN